jgi:hypothetical protein
LELTLIVVGPALGIDLGMEPEVGLDGTLIAGFFGSFFFSKDRV